MRTIRLLVIAAALAALLSSTSVVAIGYYTFNFPNVNPRDTYQYVPFQMKQGWEEGQLAWYICTDASDQQIACQQQFPLAANSTLQLNGLGCFNTLNFAPRMAELAGQVAVVYFVTGQPQPVFTALPGDPVYSGLWQVVFVTFNPGVARHCVNNTDPYDPATNPNGLPSAADATFSVLNNAGNPVVVKYPIVAVGPLGGPWQPAPGNTTIYRIAQGKVFTDYAYSKVIFLPFWNIYCSDPITRRMCVHQIVIPDACDPPGLPLEDQLVPKLGANSAPGLCLIDPADTQAFYWQIGPQPINQYPILQDCPSFDVCPCRNYNYDYTPVETVVVLQRNVPPLPLSAVINNEQTLLDFLAAGCLTTVRSSQIIDGTVLPSLKRAMPVER